MMKAEEVLNLFDSGWFGSPKPSDSCWFGIKTAILPPKYEPPSPTAMLMLQKLEEIEPPPKAPKLQIRSLSDRCITVDTGESDDSPKPKLQKILSGKELAAEVEEPRGEKRRRGSERKRLRRSLSALRLEELKAFMELGFVFSEEEWKSGRNSGLFSVQNWGKMADDSERGNGGENGNILMNWKIPSLKNEITMKDHLRIWAHTVASNVR